MLLNKARQDSNYFSGLYHIECWVTDPHEHVDKTGSREKQKNDNDEWARNDDENRCRPNMAVSSAAFLNTAFNSALYGR